MRLDVDGRSATGNVRSRNEDRYAIRQDLPGNAVLGVVADGLGGYTSGDLAATLAVDTLVAAVQRGADLTTAIADANAAIVAHARREQQHFGMGTTIACVLISGDQAQFANVGDSRGYLIRDGEARLVTVDHSFVAEEVRAGRLTVEEARRSSQRNILTRALGLDAMAKADECRHQLAPGDAIILCSDGVYTLVSDEELARAATRPAAQGSADIVNLVLARGAPDNATVVIARLLGNGPTSPSPRVTRPLPDADPEGGVAHRPGPPPAATEHAPSGMEREHAGEDQPVTNAKVPRPASGPGRGRFVSFIILVIVIVVIGLGLALVGGLMPPF